MGDIIFNNLIAPSDATELMNFYLLWITIFLLVNVVWDIASPKTPSFHFTSLSKKVTLLHSASFFCSSLLVIVACVKPDVWKFAEEIKVPILLTGVSGILTSIVAFCPYKNNDDG